jgi:hypothetical protein
MAAGSILLANSKFRSHTGGTMKKNGVRLPPFQTGQVWELVDSNVQIGLVGKLLVHYRHYRNTTHRVPISLTSKAQLEAFLRQNKAVLTAG